MTDKAGLSCALWVSADTYDFIVVVSAIALTEVVVDECLCLVTITRCIRHIEPKSAGLTLTAPNEILRHRNGYKKY